MCGIVGHYLHEYSDETLRPLLDAQLDSIRYRGPDDRGVFFDEGVALGHVRLAVIDPESGQQPLISSDGQYAVTYNGEIYNYLELKQELVQAGFGFRTQSDTEVLLAGYRHWGQRVVDKLNGMFAFAIHDRQKRLLFCARDPFGQKPFYYLRHRECFHFASELEAFRPLPCFRAELDRESLQDFLRFEAFYRDASLLRGIRKLPPGHTLTVTERGMRLNRYFREVPRETPIAAQDALDQAESLICDAVRIAFRADVPVGVLLSGGLDSSLVLAALRKSLPSEAITAYHVHVGDDRTYDESDFAAAVAKHCDAEFHQFELSLGTMASLASTVLASLDQPQADPGVVPKYFVCSKIREHGKVALTGDGGDELFYGYIVFKAQVLARYYRHVPAWVHRLVVEPLSSLLPSRSGYMRMDFLAKNFIRGFPGSEALRNSRWIRSFSPEQVRELLVDPDDGASEGERFLLELADESRESGYLGQLAHNYQNTYLPDYVLCNSDRASMLNSVELRSPLLDPRLGTFTNSLPDSIKMPGLETKHLMKKVGCRMLPHDVVYRKKIGFTIPAAQLIRGPLREEIEDLFSAALLRRQGLFRHQAIRGILDLHLSGQEDRYKQIWTLFALQKWLTAHESC